MATHSSILAWRIPWRSLMGYSPWSCKELDTTERLHFKRVTNTQGSNVGSTTCLLFDFGQVLWLLRVSAAPFVKWKQCLYWPRRVAGGLNAIACEDRSRASGTREALWSGNSCFRS